MFERKRWRRAIAILLSMTMLFTSIPAIAFAESNTASEEPDAGVVEKTEEEMSLEQTLILEDNVSEENAILDESTTESTTFDMGNGKKMIIYHSQDVRYEDEKGNLHDYDPSLVKLKSEKSENGADLTGYKFENKTGDIKHYIPEKLDVDTPVLTENGKYSISMVPLDQAITEETVIRKSEPLLTPYEQVEEKQTRAIYGKEQDGFTYEYTSLNQGIKETIILDEIPKSNVFRFEIRVEGMMAKLDSEQNIVLLNDEETDKTVAVIEKPFMNDASEEAYSEDLTYALEEQGEGSYLLTLTVSEEYLEDEERIYPVTIDPTATWKGSENFLDVYVISGSTYGDINFYDSDVRLMAAGKTSYGTYRTYIKLPNIKSTLEDKYVDSAYLTVYESGDSDADQTIKINRVTESWTTSSVTWNNKPAHYSSAVNSFTTTGTQYAAHQVSIKTTIRNFLNDNNYPNYGIVLRNTTSSPGYAEFYGSRTTLTSYRPKLVVTYYDKPTVPETLSIARYAGNEPLAETDYLTTQYMKEGHKVYATWSGIVSQNLANVEYKVIAGDDTTAEPTSVGSDNVDLTAYRSIGKSTASGTNVHVPYAGSIPEGKYRLYLRGTDAAGMHGTAKYKVFYVDGTAPTLSASISPSGTTAANPSNNAQPTISWTASDDKSLNYVSVSVDGGTAVKATGSSYTLKSGNITTDGKHIITVTAYDTAGNTTTKTLNYYYVNNGSVVPGDFSTHEAYGKRVITWSLENYDAEKYIYDLHRGVTNGFTPSSSSKLAADINAGLLYYADKTYLEEKTYYYKIVVRPRATSSNLDQLVSNQIAFDNTLTESDLSQRMGFKDHLSYFEFGLPAGTGYVEKSSGNLIYEQEDFSVSNAQLSYGLTRTYNSLNEFTGMFGKGWSDSYHKEVYIHGDDAYFMDSDGSTLKFTKTDGVYTCTESKEYALVKNADKSYTMTAKDDTVYAFNRYGQIASITEPNGCSITYTYDRYGKLASVQSKGSETGSEKTLTFTYSGNTVTGVNDPNGNIYSYSYSSGKLIKCKITDKNDADNYVAYDYGYTSAGLLNNIKDAAGNAYTITYASEKAETVTYPNGESYDLVYGEMETNVTKSNEYGNDIYTESITFDSATGKITSATDANGRKTEYKYYDSAEEIAAGNNPYLLKSETSDFYYQKLEGNTVSLNEHLIQTISYTYDENGNPDITTTSYAPPEGVTIAAADLPDTEIYDCDYNAEHQLTDETTTLVNPANEDGTTIVEDTTYTYTAEGNIASSVDTENRTSEVFGYDGDGNETACRVYNDVLTTTQIDNEIDSIDSGTTPTVETTQTSTASYDLQGNAVSETNTSADSVTKVTSAYDAMGEVVQTTENRNGTNEAAGVLSIDNSPNGAVGLVSKAITTSYEYDFLGREITCTISTLLWDEEAELEGSENPWKTQSSVTEKTYTKNGSLASETVSYVTEDPLTDETETVTVTTSYEYDSLNRNTKTTVSGSDMDTSVTETVYGYVDDHGVRIEDGLSGRTESIAYMETVKTGTPSDTDVTSVRYMDKEGNVIKEETGNTFVCYTYDNDGTQVVSYSGSSTEDEYLVNLTLEDRDGNDFAEISNPGVSNGTYIVEDNSIKTESTYDEEGNLLSETNPLGVSTAYSYDDEDRITYLKINGTAANSDSKDIAVSYIEDSDGTLTTTITDAKGNQKVEVTDAAGLILQTKDIGSSSAETIISNYSYDSLGNNILIEYGDDSYITNEFDINGRIYRSISYNSAGVKDKTAEYEYDINGNMTVAKLVEADGVTEIYKEVFDYDGNGRLVKKHVIYGNNDSDVYRKTTVYDYDARDRLTSVTYPTESGLGTVSYSYDIQGNLLNIKQNDKLVTEYSYDGFYWISQRKDYTVPGVTSAYVQRDYVYDQFGRVTSMVYTKNGQADQILESYTYAYDKDSNILSETHVNNLPADKINENKVYTYDVYGRLTKTVTTDYANNNAISTVTYGYDAVGNRVSMTEGGVTTTYTYNGLNQLTSKTDSNGETTTYSYDQRGNQIQEKTQSVTTNFTYAVTGEMLTVSNGSTVIQENEYNHEGIRIARTEGSTERKYLYDNGSVAYTLDNDSLSSANVLGGYQNVIGTYRGSDYYVYNKDIQGSTESITDSSFNAKAVYEYSDFGEVTEVVETIDNEICYTGAIHDEVTGLHYMNARYYDPSNGRFISQDSYRGEVDDYGQWHLYVYCANNPINYTDPSGHWVVTAGIKAEAACLVGAYIMLGVNYDGKHISLTWGEGIKFVLNAGAALSVIFSYSKQATLKSILGKTESIGVSVGVGDLISGGPTLSVSSGGTVTCGAQGSLGKWLSPVTVEYEYGRNTQKYKWKFSKISKSLKTHKVNSYEITKKKIDNRVRFRIKKYKIQFNVYKSGKVQAKKY